MASHVVYWKELCVRYICLGGGHMMKENSYNYGRDKKTQDKMWECDWKHSHFFLVRNFAQMWKINMKREYLISFSKEKKSLNLQKIENDVATFPCWFWFGNNVLSV